ncbi:MAG: CBS domain-containing protein [Rhodoferax sp.]|uniref:CBS domain-containing protein n=1 Tax=Rhodoferax sp. TaxID=50421 RepID=UPI002608A252|nr:CBS domain-containing protein [Rhodoferax sp.]MDD2883026.1 CBS domain-containing protein [Rhodoferax sp.]
MFMVYGTSGQLFKGSMEQLRQISGVGALARSRRILPVGRDGHDVTEESAAAYAGLAQHKPVEPDAPRIDPLAAYAPSQQGPQQQRRPLTSVADLMSHLAITLPDSATVLQAWHLLTEKEIGQAPVVDANGQLVGLLTRADLLKPERLPSPESHALVWHALLLQNVQDIMWTPVPSVSPESDIRRVAQVLLDSGLPGLPVVDEHGRVTGFISRSDILRAVVTDPPLDLWG